MLKRTATLAAISSASLDAVIATDRQGIVIGWNSIAERMFGWTEAEVLGKLIDDLIIRPADRAAHQEGLRRYNETGEVRIMGVRIERRALRKDGSEIPIELAVMLASGTGDGVFLSFLRDLTPQKEAEQQIATLQAELVHLARVNAMGTMAAMLAHEINQPLVSAAMYLSSANRFLFKREQPSLEDAKIGIDGAAMAIQRAGETIRSVRSMLSSAPTMEEDVQVSDMVSDTIRLLKGSLIVDPVVEIAPDAQWVRVHKVQVEQVLINILRNASEALRGREAPRIEIDAARQGDRVRIRIADNGPGLPPEVKASLFSPFKSAKAEGLGIGLSVSRTIIEQHGGKIWLEDEPGRTCFCFTIAAASPAPHH